MAQIIGQEARALGVNQLFAPISDLVRELRFGRVRQNPVIIRSKCLSDNTLCRSKRQHPKTPTSPGRSRTATSRGCRAPMSPQRSSISWVLACRSKGSILDRYMAGRGSFARRMLPNGPLPCTYVCCRQTDTYEVLIGCIGGCPRSNEPLSMAERGV